MSIMFVDGAEAPSTNIMDMVSPYAPGKTHLVGLGLRLGLVGLGGLGLGLIGLGLVGLGLGLVGLGLGLGLHLINFCYIPAFFLHFGTSAPNQHMHCVMNYCS